MTLKLHNNAPLTLPADRLAYAKQIVRGEAAALELVADRLDDIELRLKESGGGGEEGLVVVSQQYASALQFVLSSGIA